LGLLNEDNGLIFFFAFLAATPTARDETVVLAGEPGPIAECMLDRIHLNGWNVDMEQTEAGSTVTARSQDGRAEWSVRLSQFQAFQSVSLASITYGKTTRDGFHSTIWPLVEDCQATKN
jgi:hypothetical protein